ncbi:MAG: 23S rRNA (cytidine(2498)-2'-O)-methyltransferase RlmM [Pseudomonadota bacterium]
MREQLILLCRPGYEGDTAAEVQASTAALGVHGYCRAVDGDAEVRFQAAGPAPVTDLQGHWRLEDHIFPRQAFLGDAPEPLPERDRVGAVLERLGEQPVADALVENPDNEGGRAWTRLANALATPLRKGLESRGLWRPDDPAAPRLHLLLADHGATVGLMPRDADAPWPGGIPRLRRPADAPSRSFLKLDEAWRVLLTPEEREAALQPGQQAVDLGAAPGGWSWLLTRRHLRVIAVDNGPMAETVMETGLVEHVRADGFHYRPPRPVDWMVCDMVEQPHRVAALAADWLAGGHCRHAVVNLKLPMRQRYATVRECLDAMAATLGDGFTLRARHLYHDRDEITVYAGRA